MNIFEELKRHKTIALINGKNVIRRCYYCDEQSATFIQRGGSIHGEFGVIKLRPYTNPFSPHCSKYTWRGIVGNVKRLLKDWL